MPNKAVSLALFILLGSLIDAKICWVSLKIASSSSVMLFKTFMALSCSPFFNYDSVLKNESLFLYLSLVLSFVSSITLSKSPFL